MGIFPNPALVFAAAIWYNLMLSISSFRYRSASCLRRRADAPQAMSSTPTTMSSATAAWVSPSRAVTPAKASITPKYRGSCQPWPAS